MNIWNIIKILPITTVSTVFKSHRDILLVWNRNMRYEQIPKWIVLVISGSTELAFNWIKSEDWVIVV